MAADCTCKICVDRRNQWEEPYRKPYHLKTFDDTFDFPPYTPHCPDAVIELEGTASCNCACDRCVARRELGKTPIHLKTYDNTAHDPEKHRYGSKPHDCKNRCLRCRNGAPVNLKALDNTPISYCPDCPTTESDPDQCECTMDGWYGVPFATMWGSGEYESWASGRDVHEGVYGEIALLWVEGGIDYKRCTSKALRHLVLRRGLKDPFPSGLTLKLFYIGILSAADKALRFRFRDLPAEMRNQVYDELLISQRASFTVDKCYPQILATNREIHSDATGILYADNTLRCSFVFTHSDNPSDYRFQITLHDKYYPDSNWAENRKLSAAQVHDLAAVCELPVASKFHKIANLDIYVHASNVGDFDSHRSNGFKTRGALQNGLLAFVSSLMDGHCLKRVSLSFTCAERWWPFGQPVAIDQSSWAGHSLYPFRRLRGIDQVTVSGNISTDLAEAIAGDMQSDRPAFNTWHELQRVQALLDSYLELIRAHHLEDFAGKWKEFDELLCLSALPPAILEYNEAVFIDEEHEAEVLASIVQQERFLRSLGPAELLLSRLSRVD